MGETFSFGLPLGPEADLLAAPLPPASPASPESPESPEFHEAPDEVPDEVPDEPPKQPRFRIIRRRDSG